MDGWMDGWMDGIYLLISIDGWLDGYMDGYMDGWMIRPKLIVKCGCRVGFTVVDLDLAGLRSFGRWFVLLS